MIRTSFVASVLALVVPLGCSSSGDDATSRDDATKKPSPKVCAAVRGNGHYIMTHFGSLARVVEHYGVLEGLAGGSSGSITQFLYESMHMHPDLRKCETGACSEEEAAARMSLLLKSVMGYAEVVGGSPEARSILGLVTAFSEVRTKFDEQGIEALASSDAAKAAAEITKILGSDDIKALVNPEVFTMVTDTAHLEFNVKEVVASVKTITAFSAVENRIFFRTGVISFADLAEKMGRVADFYAGRATTDTAGMKKFLDACAKNAVGKQWSAVKELDGDGAKCGAMFTDLVTKFRAELPSKKGTYSPRVLDKVGDYAPVTKIVSTSVLTGASVGLYHDALKEYQQGKYPEGNVPFAPEFKDIKFGYWSSDAVLAKVAANKEGYKDAKTAKFEPLGDATWKEIIEASPAEPGLSNFVDLPDGKVSAGGWSDLAPVLVLKNAGCDQVVYVTREGDESTFASGIAKHLGMGETEFADVFDLDNASTESKTGSAFALSIAKSEGVWCTNWNAFTDFQTVAMFENSYGGPAPDGVPLEGRTSFVREGRFGKPYVNVVSSSGKIGCTPGLSGHTKLP
ncbi:MAG: hypothetical protein U0169_09205 [Polyangiaceae bacterium]